MKPFRCILLLVLIAVPLTPTGSASLSAQAYRLRGISPIFDGWEELPDGTRLFYFGYINRNPTEVSIPVGADNGFDPAPADRGQPTHFLHGRHEHVFTVAAPKQMRGKLVWTVKSEMGVQTANASFDQLYILEQRENADPNAKPPAIKIADLTARPGDRVALNPIVTPAVNSGRAQVEGAAEDTAGLNVQWSLYRGMGTVTFSAAPSAAPPVTAGRGRGRAAEAARPGIFDVACGTKPAPTCGAVAAVFSDPGVYTLRAAARQDGLQGLAFVRVTVRP